MTRIAPIVLLGLVIALTGCFSAYQSPVAEIDEPRFLGSDRIHRVNAGETLYAVAWIYDLDFMHIARANGLSSPYTIIPGQILNVDPRARPLATTTPAGPGQAVATPTRQQPALTRHSLPSGSTTSPARSGQSAPTPAPEPILANPVQVQQGQINWDWPYRGTLAGRFDEAGVEGKGIDIAGRKGDAILAAADGEVVYAGSGLLRYGELLIIKHNDLFLSAYAHNNALLVSEGERVIRGQKIAELGSTGVDRDMLHFEIRQEGQPVDPLTYLPPGF